ncbi:MAG: mercuric reductase [Acidobacteria bacterium]|nr:mercuric reductase [Acidobacteriota bacterium]
MNNPESERFDAIIIGTGQAGKPVAVDLANAGWKTAIIERDQVGGVCVNVGCTPTKTMVASGRVAYLAGRAADYGVQTGAVEIDMGTVRRRKRDIVELFRTGNERRLGNTENLELIRGEGRFTGTQAIEVRLAQGGERLLEAETIFINAGARPRHPDIVGLDEVDGLDSTSIMELDEVPDHLIVLGGGYIAVEFGQLFRRLGADVTIVQRRDQLLPREDADVAEAIAEVLREDGVRLILGGEATQVAPTADGGVELTVEQTSTAGASDIESANHSGSSAMTTKISGSHLLVAVGRLPNTERLGLESIGVEVDRRGNVIVDERLETNVAGVFALGDVNGGPAFTHIAYDDYRIVRDNLLGDGGATTEGRFVPYTVFIDPELGRVGITERQARQRDIDYLVAKMPMSHVARALETDETRGFMKVLVDGNSGAILGCAILGIQGGELATMIQIAMMGKLHYRKLKEATFSHPTLAESFNNLFLSLASPQR